MSITCPKCDESNRDSARFCDNCGAQLNAGQDHDAPGIQDFSAPRRTNWSAIIIVAAIIGFVIWIIAVPKSDQQPVDGMQGSTGGNPHATASDSQDGNGQMGQMMEQLVVDKQALEEDPLNVEALARLYQTYAMIERQGKVRPYLDAAMAAFKEKRSELDGEESLAVLHGLAGAALAGKDPEGAISALALLNELDPDDLSIVAVLGDVNYDLGRPAEAVKWYTEYLEGASMETAPEAYVNVKIDRATMYIQLAAAGDAELLGIAIDELEDVSRDHPDSWNAKFNLGVAYASASEKEKASAIWQQCLELPSSDMQRWRVESKLAKLRGDEPPPMPDSPHSGMGGTMDTGKGMPNPHGTQG